MVEARPGGVVRRDLTEEEDMAFRIIPMPEEYGQKALDYGRCCLGRNYDVLDCVFIVLRHYFPSVRFTYSNHNSFVCSELVVMAWRSAGLDLFPGKNAALIIPADFETFLPPDSVDESFYANGGKVIPSET